MATLLENWRNLAYGDGLNDKKREDLWKNYFAIEKGIYEKILSNPTEVVEGTVKELAEKYETDILIMTGFLDGINESLKGYENPIETMDEDTAVKIEIDPEKLYYNMVEAKASWLYGLPQWDQILSEETRTELYKKQKASGTVRREGHKIYPNDPCPCGSGKKYKKCCGRNV
ncbi:MAG TPA: SEC-C domain-containing protein [Candidatus Copromonas avistercoris]|nr:SEC-C domain-containing protein [Candidatus Copromonas avistercoris]